MIKRLIIAVLLLGIVVGGIVGFNLFRTQMIEQFFAGMQPPAVAGMLAVMALYFLGDGLRDVLDPRLRER